MRPLAEPALLGFSSGLMGLDACGPVLLPWLAAEGAGLRGTSARLAPFLVGRLAGYLVSATLAGALGLALPLPASANAARWVRPRRRGDGAPAAGRALQA